MEGQLLRFTTAGSVDNGKSTLIGRLLYDSKSIFEDQLDSVKSISRKTSGEELNLALFTDGLRDEVELGITIDVAYRYFATPKRKFIIADAPGHAEFTRNMVTAASTTNTVLIIIDAQLGITEQTKRHTYIASMLKLSNVIVCVNKMDLVNWNEEIFHQISDEFLQMVKQLSIPMLCFIPMSALAGDNVVKRSENMSWYKGKTLLDELESINIIATEKSAPARLPVQLMIRENQKLFIAGRVEGGEFKVGDKIQALPSGAEGVVKSISVGENTIEGAKAGMSVTIGVNFDMKAVRGDIISHFDTSLCRGKLLVANLCWLGDSPAMLGKDYVFQQGTSSSKAMIACVTQKVDVNTFCEFVDKKPIQMNEICKIELSLPADIFYDPFGVNKITGSFILVDPDTNSTVGAGMIQ